LREYNFNYPGRSHGPPSLAVRLLVTMVLTFTAIYSV